MNYRNKDNHQILSNQYPENDLQEMLFRVAGLPMVENCMSGYNSCVFAYGQVSFIFMNTML